MREIDCAHSRENASLTLIQGMGWYIEAKFPESGSEKHFHGSRMRAKDSPHKITPMTMIFKNF
jgi:hypothetical protein